MNVSLDRYVHQGYWGVIPTKNYVYLKATFCKNSCPSEEDFC